MSNHQLHPLETNPETGEPFLRLRNHPNIVLTPPRWEDIPYCPPILNDDRVHPWLAGPPYPYRLEDSEKWLKISKPDCDAILADLESAKQSEVLKIVDKCPVKCLREMNEDGTDRFLGEITFVRSPHGELLGTDLNSVDWENKQKNEDNNNHRQPGDPEIIWSVGYYLAPSHHGQGIMSDALGTLLNEWGIPRMGIRKMIGFTFIGNVGSTSVFKKNGFTLVRTLADHHEVKGKKQGLHVLKWTLD